MRVRQAERCQQRSLRFAIVGASLGVKSCSLFVDLDGLAGRAVPSGDASTTDMKATEGGADAGTEAGATAPFCANVDATLCDDFHDPGWRSRTRVCRYRDADRGTSPRRMVLEGTMSRRHDVKARARRGAVCRSLWHAGRMGAPRRHVR